MQYILLVVTLFTPLSAYAYIGPGMGLGMIGVILGAVLSLFLAILAILWYPFKRLLKRFKLRKSGK